MQIGGVGVFIRTDLNIMKGNRPLKAKGQYGSTKHIVAIFWRPRLLIGHPNQVIADIMVAPNNIGKRMVQVVMRVLP